MKMKTYAFDLDGTLCTLTDGNYETAEPLVDRIRHVNKIFEEGRTILIFTAREATSKRDLKDFTLKQLSAWEIKFHKLITGIPRFDLLIDDKAESANKFDWRVH